MVNKHAVVEVSVHVSKYVATSTNLWPDKSREEEENSLSNHQMSQTSPNSTFHACAFNKQMSAVSLGCPLPSIGTHLTHKVKNWGKLLEKSLKSLTLSPNNVIRIAPCAFALRVLVNKPPLYLRDHYNDANLLLETTWLLLPSSGRLGACLRTETCNRHGHTRKNQTRLL